MSRTEPTCPTCDGKGKDTFAKEPPWKDCKTCGGTGTQPKEAKPAEGLVGRLYGVEISHTSHVGDPRKHTEPYQDCWCWKENPIPDEATALSQHGIDDYQMDILRYKVERGDSNVNGSDLDSDSRSSADSGGRSNEPTTEQQPLTKYQVGSKVLFAGDSYTIRGIHIHDNPIEGTLHSGLKVTGRVVYKLDGDMYKNRWVYEEELSPQSTSGSDIDEILRRQQEIALATGQVNYAAFEKGREAINQLISHRIVEELKWHKSLTLERYKSNPELKDATTTIRVLDERISELEGGE